MTSTHKTFSASILPWALLLASLASGCSESTTAEPDTGISFMAPDTSMLEADAAPDGGATTSSDIGAACGSDADCDGYCVGEGEGYRGGYCTNFCDEATACPDGSTCVQVSETQAICYDNCAPGAADRECRAGYGCLAAPTLPSPVCIPGCTDDTDCPEGRRCNPAQGGSCYNPESDWGDSCGGSSDCPDRAFCYAEAWRGWPGGMCQAFGCDETSDTGGGCPSGTACVPGRRPGYGRCLPACETAEDCRAGYECRADATYEDRLTCQPACTEDSQCSGGRRCTGEGTCG